MLLRLVRSLPQLLVLLLLAHIANNFLLASINVVACLWLLHACGEHLILLWSQLDLIAGGKEWAVNAVLPAGWHGRAVAALASIRSGEAHVEMLYQDCVEKVGVGVSAPVTLEERAV